MLARARHQFRAKRIEITYITLTLLLLGGMAGLAALGVLDGMERAVNAFMARMVDWGLPGLFLASLVANVTLVFLIPYALPLFTLSVYADSLAEVIALGTAAGLGAGVGATISYAVAHSLVARIQDLEASPLLRWTRRTITRRPWTIPVLVWLATATPAPDVVILVPLAMIGYDWRKLVIPFLGGKVVQNVVMALVYRFAAEQASSLLSTDISFDLTATLTIVFVMLIIYQVAKARAARTGAAPAPADTPAGASPTSAACRQPAPRSHPDPLAGTD